MPRLEKVGTGITAFDALVYDLRDPTELEAWNRRPDVPLVDWLEFMELNACRLLLMRGMSPDQPSQRLMEQFNLEVDSLPIYASRILDDIKLIRAAVEQGDATAAADVSLRLGQTVVECIMKSRYEKVALHGQKIRETARANAARKREKVKVKANNWHRRARAEAEGIRREHAAWPNSRVATAVKKRLKLDVADETVRQVISRKTTEDLQDPGLKCDAPPVVELDTPSIPKPPPAFGLYGQNAMKVSEQPVQPVVFSQGSGGLGDHLAALLRGQVDGWQGRVAKQFAVTW